MRALRLLHRHRRAFVLANGLAILLFGGAAAVHGEAFWKLFHVSPGDSPLLRLLGWYLAVHGLGGVLIARAPEKQPAVLAMIGVEKIGAAVCFAHFQATGTFSWPLALIGGFDAAMAVVFLAYAAWVVGQAPSA